MSIFNNNHMSAKCRLIVLMAVISCIVFIFPIHIYAQTEGEVTEDNSSSSLVFSENLYHKHTGNADNGGGCYTVKKTGTRTVEKPCKGTMVYWPDLGSTSCSICGASYFGDQSWRDCWKTTEEVETYTYYERGCGKNTSTVLGTIHLTKDTDEWSRSVLLMGGYDSQEELDLQSEPYIWNDGEATDSNTYEVTACGEYSFALNVSKPQNLNGNKVTVEVKNVDATAPGASVSYDKETLATSVEMTVTATDLQPDGSEGCGLHEMPYSFDGGNTWTSDSVHVVTGNGTITIAVRDKLDNVTYIEEHVANVDSTGPVITYTMEPVSWTTENVEIQLAAEDVCEEGYRASGIPAEWYSLDGGETWLGDPTYIVEENQTLVVIARDLLGNESQQEIMVVHIDRKAPKVTSDVNLVGNSTQEADIQIEATDAGAGLHETAFSWDKGATFSKQNTKRVSQNGIYSVWVRDVLGNVSKEDVKVDVIQDGSDDGNTNEPPVPEKEEPSTPVVPETDENETVEVPESETPVEEPSVEEEASAEEETASTEETSTEDLTEPESTEEYVEETLVLQEELGDEPQPRMIRNVKEKAKWTVGEIVALVMLLCAFLALLAFLILLWVRTIAIYAKNNRGQWEYMGRTWIHNREEHYEVNVAQSILERCETTRLQFCPNALFAKMHEEEEIHFLFPDGVCVTLPIAQKIEME